MLGTFLFIKLKATSSGPKLLALGMLLFAMGYGGMGLSGALPMTVIFAVITSLGAGLLLPTMLTWVMSILPGNVRGRGTGFWTGMFFLGQFFALKTIVAVTVLRRGSRKRRAFQPITLGFVLSTCNKSKVFAQSRSTTEYRLGS